MQTKTFLKLFGFAALLSACNVAVSQTEADALIFTPNESEEATMTMSPVTAGDYGGSLPVTSVSCPDDGAPVEAAHIREAVAALLANDEYLKNQREVEYEYDDEAIPSLTPVIAATHTISGNTWTSTSIKIDIPNCKVGDDIKVRVWGSWMLAATDNDTTVGRARVAFYIDPAGAPALAPNVKGYVTISDDSGALTLPHNENYSMEYRYRVTAPIPTNPVTIRAVVQARSEDLSGGAGVATVIFLHSARMEITHVKRN